MHTLVLVFGAPNHPINIPLLKRTSKECFSIGILGLQRLKSKLKLPALPANISNSPKWHEIKMAAKEFSYLSLRRNGYEILKDGWQK